MKGLIFDIKHFAIHDGPGIRQTIFLKACPMRCVWCHNPESWQSEPEQFKVKKRLENKEFEVLETVGTWYNPDNLFQIIQKDIPFFNQSGGGVTFSGGEPLMQHEFVKLIAEKCKKNNIHTLVDTCGFVKYEVFEMINPVIDLYYYDLKHIDDEKHKKYTGVGTKLILENLTRLQKEGKSVVVRIPIIPSFNDHKEDIENIIQYLITININEVHLLPYHEIGKSKFNRFGIAPKNGLQIENTNGDLLGIQKSFEKAGFNVKIEN